MSGKYPWVPDDAKSPYPWGKPFGKHLYKTRTFQENVQFECENIQQMSTRMDSAPHRSTMRGAIEKLSQLIDLYEEREDVTKTETPSLTNSNGDGPWVPNYKEQDK